MTTTISVNSKGSVMLTMAVLLLLTLVACSSGSSSSSATAPAPTPPAPTPAPPAVDAFTTSVQGTVASVSDTAAPQLVDNVTAVDADSATPIAVY